MERERYLVSASFEPVPEGMAEEGLAGSEDVEDIFAALWGEPEGQEGVDAVTEGPPSLEEQLIQVEHAKTSYAAFHVAASALGSGLMNVLSSCGVACLAHGHGAMQVLGNSGLNGVSLDMLGHLHHDHDHDKDEHLPDASERKAAESALEKHTKLRALPPKKLAKAPTYLNASDLFSYLLLPAAGI